MVVRLTDSQVSVFNNAGISNEQIGNMIAQARNKGVSDDDILLDLSNRANTLASFQGVKVETDNLGNVKPAEQPNTQPIAQVETVDTMVAEEPTNDYAQMVQQQEIKNIQNAAKGIDDYLQKRGVDPSSIPASERMSEEEWKEVSDKKAKAYENQSFFETPDMYGTIEELSQKTPQELAVEKGREASWMDAFAENAMYEMSWGASDLWSPEEQEMIREGMKQAHPGASIIGSIAGNVLLPLAAVLTGGIPAVAGAAGGVATKQATKQGVKQGVKALTKKEAANLTRKQAVKKIIEGTALGTGKLAVTDAISGAAKGEEWYAFDRDLKRYADDALTGLFINSITGGALAFRHQNGVKNAANRFGGIERIKSLQNKRDELIRNGTDAVEAQKWFQKELITGLEEKEQKKVVTALKNDPKFREYFNKIAVSVDNAIESTAESITRKEMRAMTDDAMTAIKKKQNLGSVDFDTSKEGLIDALGTRSEKNRIAGNKLIEEANIVLSQDPVSFNKFNGATKTAGANLHNEDIKNALIESANGSDFAAVRAMGLSGQDEKIMAMQYAKNLLENGMENATQVEEMKKLIDNTISAKKIAGGKNTPAGAYREELNESLRTSFGDAADPNTLSGRFRGYHNVKQFEDIMTDAHDFGRNLDPIAQKDSLSNFLNNHGHASADEAIAIATSVKMGYLDKLKELAKQGKGSQWHEAVDKAKRNPELMTLFGGPGGLDKYVKEMEPEIKAAETIKNIIINSTPSLSKDPSVAQEALGSVIAMGTNSPIASTNHLMRIWNQVAPGGVTPAVGKQMQAIMENPSWDGLNKLFQIARKDPISRKQLADTLDIWYGQMTTSVAGQQARKQNLYPQNFNENIQPSTDYYQDVLNKYNGGY